MASDGRQPERPPPGHAHVREAPDRPVPLPTRWMVTREPHLRRAVDGESGVAIADPHVSTSPGHARVREAPDRPVPLPSTRPESRTPDLRRAVDGESSAPIADPHVARAAQQAQHSMSAVQPQPPSHLTDATRPRARPRPRSRAEAQAQPQAQIVSLGRGAEQAASGVEASSRSGCGDLDMRVVAGSSSAAASTPTLVPGGQTHARAIERSSQPEAGVEEQAMEEAGVEEQAMEAMTLVVKNIPARATMADVVKTVRDSGFTGQWEYIYLPRKRNGAQNKGYAFARFHRAWQALRFRDALAGSSVSGRGSQKHLSVEVSAVTISLQRLVWDLVGNDVAVTASSSSQLVPLGSLSL